MASSDRQPVSDRYSRQMNYHPLGREGQQRLGQGRATLIGCGALGSMIANLLVRSGVGYLRIIDRDVVELNNLHRQVLFDETDVAEGLPKAEAARRKLAAINSTVIIDAEVTDAHSGSIERLIDGADVLLDGTDNFETRYLINDAAVSRGIPWVYGGVVEGHGTVMAIVPGKTPCLRCVFPEPPAPGETETCETVGVLGSAVAVIAAFQATEAMKILAGRSEALHHRLIHVDVWGGRLEAMNAGPGRQAADCVCCGARRFEFLNERSSTTAVLCGQNALQITPAAGASLDLGELADRLAGVADGRPVVNRFMLKCTVDRCELVVFRDGRAIIKGTHSSDEARCLYARYIGI